MADKEPLLFRAQLGALRPITAASEEALRAFGDEVVRADIKRTTGNTKRMAWYWVMLKLALENMDDAFDGPISPKALHRWMKRKYGIATPIRSRKTGEIVDWDYNTISFAGMPENERAEFIDFVSKKLSARLGVDVATLKQEAQAAV